MFQKPYNILGYILSLVLIILGGLFETNITAYVAILIFLVWDINYYFSKSAFGGRDVSDLSTQIIAARQYLSYFLPFYGVLFGILFTLESGSRQFFFSLAASAGVNIGMLVSPFLLSSIPIMFFPIQTHKNSEKHSPTSSLKSLFLFTVFCQKASIYIFVHILIRILWRIHLKT